MASVNYKGVESVCRYLETTKRTYFAIYQVGKLTKPVFKQVSRCNIKAAIEIFREWANIILEGDPEHNLQYELRLYDTVDEGETDDESTFKAGRQGLVVTFVLSTKDESIGRFPAQPQNNFSSELMDAKVENMRLTMVNQSLQEKLMALDQRLSDLEEDDEDEGDGVSGMESPLMQMLMPLLTQALSKPASPAMPIPAQQRPAINGIDTDLLTQAIAILQKHDEQIDQDLMKLATVAENNPGQFQFLLNALRSM